MKIDQTLSPFYCETALILCIEAKKLCERGECAKVSRLCLYISTLCSENCFETCRRESFMCNKVGEYCQVGQPSEECKKAHIACDEARRLCPQNNRVTGA